MFKSQSKKNLLNNSNIYFPKRNYSITFLKPNPLLYKPNPISEKEFFIRRDNEMLTARIIKIATRPNKLLEPSKGVESYKKEKEKSLKSIRKLYKQNLEESNLLFQNKLNRLKSFINNKKIKEDYLLTRKVYHNLRKIYPNNSFKFHQKSFSVEELINKSQISRNNSNLPLIKIFPNLD